MVRDGAMRRRDALPVTLFGLLPSIACATERPTTRSDTDVPSTTPLRVAITVDDLPVHGPAFPGIDRQDIATRLLQSFAAHGVAPVVGFVNGKVTDEDPTTIAILQAWLRAGHLLGNHTYSHPSLHAMPVDAFVEDIARGEAILEQLGAWGAWKSFRYPFLHEGESLEKRDAVRSWLAERGYTRAPVTVDGQDWAYNTAFARCAERRDAAALAYMKTMFVRGHVDALHRARTLARALVGHDVPHVLLLHIGAADAEAIDALLEAYETTGVQWISLEEALSDPFYAMETERPFPDGLTALDRMAEDRGVSGPALPNFAAELDAMCTDAS